MAYQHYLRAQSSDCIRLAVEQPWSDDAGDLIDLAQDYRSVAAAFEEQDGRVGSAEEPIEGGIRFFGWLTRH